MKYRYTIKNINTSETRQAIATNARDAIRLCGWFESESHYTKKVLIVEQSAPTPPSPHKMAEMSLEKASEILTIALKRHHLPRNPDSYTALGIGNQAIIRVEAQRKHLVTNLDLLLPGETP